MKKLLIVAAAITMACSIHAASFTWGNGSFDYSVPNGEADYDAGKAFLYLGTVTADSSAFNTSGATLIASSLFDDTNWVYGNVDVASLSTSDAVTSTAAGQDFTLIIVDKDVDSLDNFEGNYYLYNGKSDTQGVIPGVTPVYYAQFMDMNSVADWATMGGSTPTPGPIPEPTSGLLMLLGMAGLALRRKQK